MQGRPLRRSGTGSARSLGSGNLPVRRPQEKLHHHQTVDEVALRKAAEPGTAEGALDEAEPSSDGGTPTDDSAPKVSKAKAAFASATAAITAVPRPIRQRSLPPPQAPVLRFELLRASFVQLKSIDVVEQTFRAHVMVELVLAGGWIDQHLSIQSDEWPNAMAADGTFRPSALWFLNHQFDYPNAQDFTVMESKVFRRGDDLHLIQRVDGEFNEEMGLTQFPFDSQSLTVVFCINCAAEGPVPVGIDVADDVLAAVDRFSHPNIWQLADGLALSVHEV